MRVKFQAGRYEYGSGYIRSIARFIEKNELWEIDFVLVNTAQVYQNGDEAAQLAKWDIDRAQQKALEKRGELTIDHYLASIGYEKIEAEEQ